MFDDNFCSSSPINFRSFNMNTQKCCVDVGEKLGYCRSFLRHATGQFYMRDISQVHNSVIKISFIWQLPGRNKKQVFIRHSHFPFFFFLSFVLSLFFVSLNMIHFRRSEMISKIFINV